MSPYARLRSYYDYKVRTSWQPNMAKKFEDLTEREVLCLAISLEEEDGRMFGEFAERLRIDYPGTARLLEGMQAEEGHHREQLLQLHRTRFGEHIWHVQRTDIRGFVSRPSVWLLEHVNPSAVRRMIDAIETETSQFYLRAAAKVLDPSTRRLLSELAEAELKHTNTAAEMEREHVGPEVASAEAEAYRRAILLQYIQPGLAGLMDGSVSTLAPLFAAAFATGNSNQAFLVGLAASVGAGISMGFAEALSDSGTLTGRGKPLVRGAICGAMTTAGGIGHTIPYLIPDFRAATTIAILVVAAELAVISWVRHRFMETPLLRASVQVALGGILVFLAGLFIGKA